MSDEVHLFLFSKVNIIPYTKENYIHVNKKRAFQRETETLDALFLLVNIYTLFWKGPHRSLQWLLKIIDDDESQCHLPQEKKNHGSGIAKGFQHR